MQNYGKKQNAKNTNYTVARAEVPPLTEQFNTIMDDSTSRSLLLDAVKPSSFRVCFFNLAVLYYTLIKASGA